MRMKIAIAVCMAGFLVTGCGDSDSGEAGSKAPTEKLLPQSLPKPTLGVEIEPEGSPAADASFSENLEHELRGKVLDMTRSAGRTTAECPEDLGSKSGTTATCKTTFDGLELLWHVSIGETSGWSDSMVEYQAESSKGILTQVAVARYMYGNDDRATDVRCSNLPKAVVVPMETETEYRCQTVDKSGKPGLTQTLRLTDAGVRAY